MTRLGTARTFGCLCCPSRGVTMTPMEPIGVSDETQPTTDVMTADRRLTYVATEPEDGDLAGGKMLLDGSPIARLSRRLRRTGATTSGDALDAGVLPASADAVWHAHAIGWSPHSARPWDTRITGSAPTQRRAAEDVLRAYANRR